MRRVVATLIAAGALAAASNAWAWGNAPQKAKPLPPPNFGIIVISTSAERVCWAYGLLASVVPGEGVASPKGFLGINIDNPLVKGDFPDHVGSLSVLTLPAGPYRLALTPANSLQLRFNVIPTWTFDVTAGEVAYLGDLDVSPSCTTRPEFNILDRQDRDIALLGQMNPAFVGVAVTKRLPIRQQ